MSAVEGLLERAVKGHGAVVGVVGPPGIGKSRLVEETAAMARGRGVEVFSTFGESHASDVPFHVAARLLRDAARITDLDDEAARTQLRAQVPGANDEDLVLLDDLLGIRDPDVPLPSIEPGCAAAAVDRADQHRIAGPHRSRQSLSLRMCTGSTRSANPCWRTFWR